PSTSLLIAVSTIHGSLVAPGARVYSVAVGGGGPSLISCATKSIDAWGFGAGGPLAACPCAGCTLVVPAGRFFRVSSSCRWRSSSACNRASRASRPALGSATGSAGLGGGGAAAGYICACRSHAGQAVLSTLGMDNGRAFVVRSQLVPPVSSRKVR